MPKRVPSVVVVRQEGAKIILSAEDDGRGFDARRVRGLGLVGMEERVRHLGGAFHVRSTPGTGTKVDVELPLQVETDVTLFPNQRYFPD